MLNFSTDLIHQTNQKSVLSSSASRAFFAEWCRINDNIVPVFISRSEWEAKRQSGTLLIQNTSSQDLFLPEDLHLWEIIDIVKSIDQSTYRAKPHLHDRRTNQITQLGEMFAQAGLYLQQYSPDIPVENGRAIAENIAREFYQYGKSLQSKSPNQDALPQSTDIHLSEEEKQKVDEWLLGKHVYQKRMSRL